MLRTMDTVYANTGDLMEGGLNLFSKQIVLTSVSCPLGLGSGWALEIRL